MEKDIALALIIVFVVSTIVISTLVIGTRIRFKNFLYNELHSTEKNVVITGLKGDYVGHVYYRGNFFKLTADGDGWFTYKKEPA